MTMLSYSLTVHELMYAAHEPSELAYLLHRGRLCCTELWASNETTDQRVKAETRPDSSRNRNVPRNPIEYGITGLESSMLNF